MPVCELQQLRSTSADADKAKRECQLECLAINMSLFLKGQQRHTWRFLALVQPGYVPLQLPVKIPEQKWLIFTISLKHVQSNNWSKRKFLCTPTFPLSQLISSTLLDHLTALEGINAISANSPRNLKELIYTTPTPIHTSIFTQTHLQRFQELLGVWESLTNHRESRFPLKEEILPSPMQPPS